MDTEAEARRFTASLMAEGARSEPSAVYYSMWRTDVASAAEAEETCGARDRWGSSQLSEVAQKTRLLAEPLCEELGLELVDVQFRRQGRRWLLSITADKPDGITVEDLKKLSKELSPLLDIEDFVAQQYVLEVSSPGVMRPLRRLEDFERFVGQKAKVVLWQAIEGKKTLIAEIAGVKRSEGCAQVELETEKGEHIAVSLDDINKATLHYTTEELIAGADKRK